RWSAADRAGAGLPRWAAAAAATAQPRGTRDGRWSTSSDPRARPWPLPTGQREPGRTTLFAGFRVVKAQQATPSADTTLPIGVEAWRNRASTLSRFGGRRPGRAALTDLGWVLDGNEGRTPPWRGGSRTTPS